jgi:hypothetical protein
MCICSVNPSCRVETNILATTPKLFTGIAHMNSHLPLVPTSPIKLWSTIPPYRSGSFLSISDTVADIHLRSPAPPHAPSSTRRTLFPPWIWCTKPTLTQDLGTVGRKREADPQHSLCLSLRVLRFLTYVARAWVRISFGVNPLAEVTQNVLGTCHSGPQELTEAG